MKIIFFGSSRFVLPVIEMLKKNVELALVVTTETDPLDAVPTYCQQNNIPYLSVEKLDAQAQERIKQIGAPVAVLGYFGILLPQVALEIFPKGILNIHPSLLPKYRGPTPVQSAILNGDSETGVTIIKLDREMDHGPILAQEKETILPTDTTVTLHDRLFTKGAKLLETAIPEYLSGNLLPKEQNHEAATLTKRGFTRQDGFIALSEMEHMSTLEIENWKLEIARMIRAYYPWPAVWFTARIKKKEVRIKLLPASVCHPELVSGSYASCCLQVEGKKPVSLKDFLNGYPELHETIMKLIPSEIDG